MKSRKEGISQWLFGIAGLVILLGVLMSISLFLISNLGIYPTLIADAYREDQHHLTVPGSIDVELKRMGAYGIYYEYSLISAAIDNRTNLPPEIECSLVSKLTGKKIRAVPDYVETNRYWSKDQASSGVLIMSITVDKPGTYSFECHHLDGSTEHEIAVALGPNYFWEFLRVAWNIALPLLVGIGVMCVSTLLAMLLVIAGIILKVVNITQRPNSS